VYEECHALADKRGAAASSFMGTAGTGDLVATVLAAHSRNRRAGELLAQGVEPEEIPGILGQVPESLHAVPLLARAMREEGMKSTATAELAALAEGRIGPEQWVKLARRARAGSRAA
jgi:glycerol-3-phosphate dehydrogenase (NAD(P)+)